MESGCLEEDPKTGQGRLAPIQTGDFMQIIKWAASYFAAVFSLVVAVGLIGFTFGACFGAANYAFKWAFQLWSTT